MPVHFLRNVLKGSLIGLFMIVAGIVTAAEENGFFRYPDVHGDLVVFTSEGDLWSASLTKGGPATRLTRHDGHEVYARISPDGRWIAFTAKYDGNTDVYVIPVSGGEPKRLTFHPFSDEVVGWKDRNHVIFRSARNQPNFTYNLYTVDINGDAPETLGLDKGTRISFEPGGDRFAYNRLRREQRPWKRYRGGWAMDIWVGSLKTMEFRNVTEEFEGTDGFPMWFGDRIYFLSDRSGRANIFSMNADGKQIRQHTRVTDYDIRWPSGDGKTIVYQKAMDLYAYDLASGKTRKLNIQLPSDRFLARNRIVDPSRWVDDYSIPNSGKRLALAARGEIFTAPVEKKGYIRRLTQMPESREKYVAYSPDGKQVAFMSDASGEEEIWIVPSDGSEEPKQLTHGGDQWRFPMVWSPDGKKLMFSDKSGHLYVVDADNGKLREIVKSKGWEIRNYEWAPDSKWISWAESNDVMWSNIYLFNLESGEKIKLTDDATNDYNLTWDPEGKYLYFVSDRWFNPVISVMDETHIYNRTSKFYIVLLAKDTENPFAPKLVEAFEEEEEENEEEKAEDVEKKDDDEKEEKGVKVVIDTDGLKDRIYPVPIDAGNYSGAIATKGRIYYAAWDNWGMMDEEDHGKGWKLFTFDIEKEKVDLVTPSAFGLSASSDREKLLVKNGPNSYVVMDAGATSIPEEDGHVDLSGWQLEIEPRAEWAQILREVWRWQRDFFYDPNMHGVNWNAVWKQYSKLLPRISTRAELNDLISEMIGELNIGHAYIWGGDKRGSDNISVGVLGADLEETPSGAVKIQKILHGEGWGDEPVSSLAASLTDIREGEYIVAVDGIELTPGSNLYSTLVGKSGKEVMLTVNDSPKMKGARDVLVKAMSPGKGAKLRYLDWVRERKEYVERQTNGKVAYVHLPNMMGDGLSMWGRMYLSQYKKEGLIIDVRNNGGGFVAEQILSMLERTLWARGKGRETPYYHRPSSAFWGPMVAICNHEAGSDAETFSEGFKQLELGDLIGTRTWGGWVGIRGGRKTVDNGGNTQPEFSGWDALDGHWLIEGHGVDPTIEVQDDPASMIQGKDPQLDAAIQNVMKKMKTWPKLAEPAPYPVRPLKIHNMK